MLEVRDLSFAYSPTANELFDGMSYAFTRGSMTAVTGPSGRGKSTLLYVLGLMLQPTRGEIYLRGEPVGLASDRSRSLTRARDIGFVFQDASLDPSRSVLSSVIERRCTRAGGGSRSHSTHYFCWSSSGWEVGAAIGPARSLAGRLSGSRWRARSSTTLR
ncbi:ATP-binding cassette domain-containing protein [Oerskovia sp. M15]